MYLYSKKSRRRMHAIPAALALSFMALAWLFSDDSVIHAAESPQVLLSAQNADQWSIDCDNCFVEPQYDVLMGDVVRLQSHSEMVLSLEPEYTVKHPQLSWRWTVDPYADEHPLIRLTVQVAETNNWPERTLHYIWDSGREMGATEALSDFEYVIVVNGKSSKAQDWQQVVCNLDQDWQRIYNEHFPKIARLELALGMPGRLGVSGAFIESLSLVPGEFPENQDATAAGEIESFKKPGN